MPLGVCTTCGNRQRWSNRRGSHVGDYSCRECGAPLRGLNKVERLEERKRWQNLWDQNSYPSTYPKNQVQTPDKDHKETCGKGAERIEGATSRKPEGIGPLPEWNGSRRSPTKETK